MTSRRLRFEVIAKNRVLNVSISKDPSLANLDYFQAGSLHNYVDLLQIIRDGVRVDNFFRHFKEILKENIDSAVPPISSFPNSPCCYQFTDFIDGTVLAWISQGVI